MHDARKRGATLRWLAFAVAGALALAWWLLGSSDREIQTATVAPAAPERLPSVNEPSSPRARPAAPLRRDVPRPAIDEREEKLEYNRKKAEGARRALAGIEINRNFPFWTRPLDDANRWHPPQPFHEKQRGPLSEQHVLEIWPRERVFFAGDPLIVHARAWVDGEPVAVVMARGITESRPSLLRPIVEFSFNDDGADGDDVAGDLVYSATIVIDPADVAAHPGGWGFRVMVDLPGDEHIETTDAFAIYPTNVVLTSEYRDVIEDGSLAIYVGVAATEPAAIQVRAELHGSGGEDIAFAWANQSVPKGESDVRLLFYGKAIYDRGVDGPYLLQHVALGVPSLKLVAPVATETAYATKPYRHEQFTREAYGKDNPLFDDQKRQESETLRAAEANELEPPGGGL